MGGSMALGVRLVGPATSLVKAAKGTRELLFCRLQPRCAVLKEGRTLEVLGVSSRSMTPFWRGQLRVGQI